MPGKKKKGRKGRELEQRKPQAFKYARTSFFFFFWIKLGDCTAILPILSFFFFVAQTLNIHFCVLVILVCLC